jgi:predicted nucleotidyltransferase
MRKDYPSRHVQKFGFMGTSCAGKTTLALETLARLKRAGVHADGVLQLDRRFSFQRELLEIDPIAQWSFITNQVKAEADMMLRKGVDVLVCDRTPLDFYAYYEWQYGVNEALKNFVFEWCKTTYTKIWYLPPLPYINDGMRLDEVGRDEADSFVVKVSNEAADVMNVEFVTNRESVIPEVFSLTGKILSSEQLDLLPKILGVPQVLVGGSYAFNRATKWSDVDVYLVGDKPIETDNPEMVKYAQRAKDVLGVPVEVRQVVPEVHDYLVQQGFKVIKAV